jgi:hypothetical protein
MKNLLFMLLVVAALLVAVSVRPVHAGESIEVCHVPPGNGPAHYILIDESALGAHLAHGDATGNIPNHPNPCQVDN